MKAMTDVINRDVRRETDSLGEVDVSADKLWGAQTQRSLEHDARNYVAINKGNFQFLHSKHSRKGEFSWRTLTNAGRMF
jgi:hypothetical protein